MLTLRQTHGAGFNKKDFLNQAETALFKEMRASGQITIFNVKICSNEECEAEVPRSKKYCSKSCKEEVEGEQ